MPQNPQSDKKMLLLLLDSSLFSLSVLFEQLKDRKLWRQGMKLQSFDNSLLS